MQVFQSMAVPPLPIAGPVVVLQLVLSGGAPASRFADLNFRSTVAFRSLAHAYRSAWRCSALHNLRAGEASQSSMLSSSMPSLMTALTDAVDRTPFGLSVSLRISSSYSALKAPMSALLTR